MRRHASCTQSIHTYKGVPVIDDVAYATLSVFFSGEKARSFSAANPGSVAS